MQVPKAPPLKPRKPNVPNKPRVGPSVDRNKMAPGQGRGAYPGKKPKPGQ